MTLPFAGVVVVWSGSRPMLETHRIPAEGLVFGRQHADPSDERISRAHVAFTIQDSRIVVTDQNSRNGTFVNGRPLVDNSETIEATVVDPAIVRTGRTVSVLVADLRPYEHVPISRRGGLVVAGSLDRVCRAIDIAAVEEEHVLILGARSIGRSLALDYAIKLGGKYVVIDTSQAGVSVTAALEAASSPRTIILLAFRDFEPAEGAAIASWLETDVRFVTIANWDGVLRQLPEGVPERLSARQITIPMCRFDELPTTLADMLDARSPRTKLHASAIELLLLRARDMGEDKLLAQFRRAIDEIREPIIRREHLEPYFEEPIPWHHGRIIPPR